MRKLIKTSLICLCLSLVFLGAAQAATQPKQPVKQKVAVFVFDSFSPSFADLLSPGLSLGKDLSPLFGKRLNVTWTINSIFLFLAPDRGQPGPAGVFAFYNNDPSGNNAWAGFGASPIAASVFSNVYYVPSVLLVFYQEQVTAVPEAGAGVMMALGLPLVGWLAWRRRSAASQA